jgi:hypothetical protein
MGFIYTDPVQTANLSYGMKDIEVKVFSVPFSYFATGNVDTLLGTFPADTAFLGFDVWVGTVLAGNGVTSPVVSLGSASGGTQFASAVAVTNSAGYNAKLTPVTGILQAHDNINRTDIRLFLRGGCSTGTPTSGQMYLVVYFAR